MATYDPKGNRPNRNRTSNGEAPVDAILGPAPDAPETVSTPTTVSTSKTPSFPKAPPASTPAASIPDERAQLSVVPPRQRSVSADNVTHADEPGLSDRGRGTPTRALIAAGVVVAVLVAVSIRARRT